MRKISVFIMLGLLAIIAIHCVDNVISQPPDKLESLYRDLRKLEYRVRELGFIQRGNGFITGASIDTVVLRRAYRDVNYTVVVNPTEYAAMYYWIISPTEFVVRYTGQGTKGYSWLTIGR